MQGKKVSYLGRYMRCNNQPLVLFSTFFTFPTLAKATWKRTP